MQERGEVAEEELRALEEDITGRVSLFSTKLRKSGFDVHVY